MALVQPTADKRGLERLHRLYNHRRFIEPAALETAFAAFRHRYASGRDLAALLAGMRRVLPRHGSLNRAFTAGLDPRAPHVLPALGAFVEAFGCGRNCLLPHPGQAPKPTASCPPRQPLFSL